MVLINMHGAMVAEGYLDCEGDLLGRIRALVGPDTVIGGELDLHCSITRAMTDAADALITFKEYPHIDGREAPANCSPLPRRPARRRPPGDDGARSAHDQHLAHQQAPGADIVAAMQEAERRNDILACPSPMAFPGATCPRPAPRSWSSAMTRRPPERRWPKISPSSSGGPARASTRRCRRCRRRSTAPWRRPRARWTGGLGRCRRQRRRRRAIGSDLYSAASAGRGVRDVVSGFLGSGGRTLLFRGRRRRHTGLRIGGKCGPDSGPPVDLEVTVRRLLPEARQSFGSAVAPMGRAAWISGAGIDLILNEARTQVFHPDGFTQFGIDLAAARLIVVKSTQHFYAGFAPLAREIIYVSAPGAIPPEFAEILSGFHPTLLAASRRPLRRRRRDLSPRPRRSAMSIASWAEGQPRHGAVAAGNPDAVNAGLALLADGGNAIDAIVAAAFAMGVVEPLDCGLGGGGFATVHAAGVTECLDFIGAAPLAARYRLYQTHSPVDGYRISVRGRANELGHRSVAVPGAAAGLDALLARFGTRPLAAVLAPAIALAEDGYTIARKPALRLARTEESLRLTAETARVF